MAENVLADVSEADKEKLRIEIATALGVPSLAGICLNNCSAGSPHPHFGGSEAIAVADVLRNDGFDPDAVAQRIRQTSTGPAPRFAFSEDGFGPHCVPAERLVRAAVAVTRGRSV